MYLPFSPSPLVDVRNRSGLPIIISEDFTSHGIVKNRELARFHRRENVYLTR